MNCDNTSCDTDYVEELYDVTLVDDFDNDRALWCARCVLNESPIVKDVVIGETRYEIQHPEVEES
jgi:hypothetical protein